MKCADIHEFYLETRGLKHVAKEKNLNRNIRFILFYTATLHKGYKWHCGERRWLTVTTMLLHCYLSSRNRTGDNISSVVQIIY